MEMLISIAILGVAFVAILQTFSTGFQGLNRSEARAIAALHARSTLETVAARQPLEPGEWEGELDARYRWAAAVRPYEAEEAAAAADAPVVAYEIDVLVTWGANQSLRLQSLRLGQPQ